jgi:hypothetical protein
MLEAMRRNKEKFLPKQGYNVVGVDDFEVPGEQLYLVGHFVTREEADEARKRFEERNPGHEAHVYGPEDG